MNHAARFAVIVICAAAAAAGFISAGIGPQPFLADDTCMSRVSLVLALIGTVMVARRAWGGVRWIANALPYVGLIGTTLGLVMLSADLAQGAGIDDLKQLLAAGIGPALFPNLVASAGYLWLSLLARVLGGEDV